MNQAIAGNVVHTHTNKRGMVCAHIAGEGEHIVTRRLRSGEFYVARYETSDEAEEWYFRLLD